MERYIDLLVANNDFESVAEFYEMLKADKTELIKDLKWRADGGLMKGEEIAEYQEYIQACQALLNMI